MLAKRNLYIIGASAFGREMESWLGLIPEDGRDWVLRGFLHTYEGVSPLAGYPSDCQILGEWEQYPLSLDDYCLIAVADCGWKELIYNKLKDKVSFYTYIAPNVVVGKFNDIGEGCIVCPNCVMTTNVTLGKCVTVNIGSQIGHDAHVGSFSSLMANVDIAGKCQLGSGVFVGSGATVIPGTKIEDNAKVGAGSVVIKKVRKDTTVFGNPALKIG